MGSTIRILSENLIRKIAAGEVIERPASVVKELAENAVDAGASRILVETEDGGQQLILVADDGHGMTRQDVELCTQRHATSKMAHPSDLFAIETLGFRGEALASIGAVSRLCIQTRIADAAEGTCLAIEGGVQRGCSVCARARGTTVTVRNLFFNTPVRRKFLRQRSTEIRHITNAIVNLAAARPDIGFELRHDGRPALDLLPSEPVQRAAELLGVPAVDLVEVTFMQEGIQIDGYLCGGAAQRQGRGAQFLMVRGRPVVAHGLTRMVAAGYGSLLRENAQPGFVLWVDLDPSQVDVNVHPTKREIRLADEPQVAEAIQLAVRAAVRGPAAPVVPVSPSRFSHGGASLAREGAATALNLQANDAPPELTKPDASEQSPSSAALETANSVAPSGAVTTPGRPEHRPQAWSTEVEQDALELVPPAQLPGAGGRRSWHAESTASSSASELATAGSNRRFWQVHGEFIMVQSERGILVVDQQAAHERVLYERALAAFRDAAGSQQLLFPLTLRLGAAELDAARQTEGLLSNLGFGVREFGRDTILLDAVPAALSQVSEEIVLRNLLGHLTESAPDPQDIPGNENTVAAAYARSAAVSRGQHLTEAEVFRLLDDLARTAEPFQCPRGRPTILRLTMAQIRQLFERQSRASLRTPPSG